MPLCLIEINDILNQQQLAFQQQTFELKIEIEKSKVTSQSQIPWQGQRQPWYSHNRNGDRYKGQANRFRQNRPQTTQTDEIGIQVTPVEQIPIKPLIEVTSGVTRGTNTLSPIQNFAVSVSPSNRETTKPRKTRRAFIPSSPQKCNTLEQKKASPTLLSSEDEEPVARLFPSGPKQLDTDEASLFLSPGWMVKQKR